MEAAVQLRLSARQRRSLTEQHPGAEYIAFLGGKVVASGSDWDKVKRRAIKDQGDKPFVILHLAGEPESIVTPVVKKR